MSSYTVEELVVEYDSSRKRISESVKLKTVTRRTVLAARQAWREGRRASAVILIRNAVGNCSLSSAIKLARGA